MHYEINVSLNGVHFFATDERSIQTESKCKQVYEAFKVRFPEAEGFKITVTQWRKTGTEVKF